ncbi:hypothetical protein PMAYCL1PPCAC_22305, partial [Pristionchus mayeri]
SVGRTPQQHHDFCSSEEIIAMTSYKDIEEAVKEFAEKYKCITNVHFEATEQSLMRALKRCAPKTHAMIEEMAQLYTKFSASVSLELRKFLDEITQTLIDDIAEVDDIKLLYLTEIRKLHDAYYRLSEETKGEYEKKMCTRTLLRVDEIADNDIKAIFKDDEEQKNFEEGSSRRTSD